jgi:geranylgeranyl diphosphate synthase type I
VANEALTAMSPEAGPPNRTPAVGLAALDRRDLALGELGRAARDRVPTAGKRQRPTLAFCGWRGPVGRNQPVKPALAALELTHAFALVHDDLMDASDTQHGRPTAHLSVAATRRRA